MQNDGRRTRVKAQGRGQKAGWGEILHHVSGDACSTDYILNSRSQLDPH